MYSDLVTQKNNHQLTSSLLMISFFPRLYGHVQHILCRRQWASGKFSKSARWIVCLIKIQNDGIAACHWFLGVQKAAGLVSMLCIGFVAKQDEKFIPLVNGIQTVGFPFERKDQGT